MTQQKHLKRRVRERMLKTGESYVTARRSLLRQTPSAGLSDPHIPHVPGSIPAATALRTLLAQHGVCAPHTDQPLSEAMVFGIAGGIGAGAFAFRYEKEDFSSFFVAGRHLWDDDLAYLQRAAGRVGLRPEVREAGGAKKGLAQLLELLQAGRPVIAWVDMANLPYRGMPESWSGGGYHVIVIYAVDSSGGSAIIGDLADSAIEISLSDLARARARIGKQKHRLLALTGAAAPIDLAVAVREGLLACHAGLIKGRSANFTLTAFKNWGEQMAEAGKEGWQVRFPGPRNLWRGLTSVYEFTEHYGTGGGLSRPIFSDFLEEAGQALRRADLAELAGRYAELGALWSALAEAALPDGLRAFEEAKRLYRRKAELFLSEGADGREAYAETRARLHELAEAPEFPLGAPAVEALLQDLSGRVGELYRREALAAKALAEAARR